MKFALGSPIRSHLQVEFDNELENLQCRWQAYHANSAAESLQSLVDDTKHLERVASLAPGQLLDKLRKNG
jgi:hypothetical protein